MKPRILALLLPNFYMLANIIRYYFELRFRQNLKESNFPKMSIINRTCIILSRTEEGKKTNHHTAEVEPKSDLEIIKEANIFFHLACGCSLKPTFDIPLLASSQLSFRSAKGCRKSDEQLTTTSDSKSFRRYFLYTSGWTAHVSKWTKKSLLARVTSDRDLNDWPI